MTRKQARRLAVGLVAGIVGTLVALEILLRLVPIQNGVAAANRNPQWPVHHLEPHRDIQWSSGWNLANRVARSTNNFGYVAPFDYTRGAEIVAVLGDSYVESLMNPYRSTFQARLAARLDRALPVYNFAVSAAALPDYLGMASLLTREFRPRYVVLVISEGDFREGFDRQPGHFSWTERPTAGELVTLNEDVARSAVHKHLRDLALFRYLRGNLRLTPRALLGKSTPGGSATAGGPDEPAACAPVKLSDADRKRVQLLVEALPEAYGLEPERFVILRDSESARRAVYRSRFEGKDEPVCATRDSEALQLLMAVADRAGMRTADLTPAFERYVEGRQRRVDHSPLDWHWNAAGHDLAARVAYQMISSARSENDPIGRLARNRH